MPASERGPVAAAGPAARPAAPVARSVAEDLEAIFTEPPAHGAPLRRKLSLRVVARRSGAGPGRRERRLASLGALAAAACVGVSAGALVFWEHAPPRASHSSAGAPVLAESVALPEPGPLPTAQLAVSLPPLAPPAPEAAPAKLVHAAAREPADHRPAGHKATTPKPANAVAGCAGKAACAPSALKTADARLRRAYASAERAGVAHAVLADYRDEWSRLRRRAPAQPTAVAARYRQMAAELSRLAAHQRVAHAQPTPPPPQPGPWKRFRTELASLWR